MAKEMTEQQRNVQAILRKIKQESDPVQWPRATDDKSQGYIACYIVGTLVALAAIVIWAVTGEDWKKTIFQQICVRLGSVQGTMVFCTALLFFAIGGLLRAVSGTRHEIGQLRRDFRAAVDNMTKPAETP